MVPPSSLPPAIVRLGSKKAAKVIVVGCSWLQLRGEEEMHWLFQGQTDLTPCLLRTYIRTRSRYSAYVSCMRAHTKKPPSRHILTDEKEKEEGGQRGGNRG